MKKLHVSAYIGHHQVFSTDLRGSQYIWVGGCDKEISCINAGALTHRDKDRTKGHIGT